MADAIVILVENGVLRAVWATDPATKVEVVAIDTDDESYEQDMANLRERIARGSLAEVL